MLLGDLDAAETVLERCTRVIQQSGTLMPFHLSAYARSRLMLDVALLEAGGKRAVRRRARSSLRQAVRLAGKVASRRPEVFKLAGHLDWVRGRRRRALGWWRRSLAAGEALGTRPELARTRLEVGLRLAGAPGGPGSLDGVSAAELLDQGRAELEALDLDLGSGAARGAGRGPPLSPAPTAPRRRLVRAAPSILATGASALLFAASFPPLEIRPLAWIALVPFLVALRGVDP